MNCYFPCQTFKSLLIPMQPAATFSWILLLNIVKTKVLLQERERPATDVACSRFGHSNTAVQNIIYEVLIFDTVLKRFGVIVFALFREDKTFFKDLFPFVLHKSNYFLCCTIGFKEHRKRITSAERAWKTKLDLKQTNQLHCIFFFSSKYDDDPRPPWLVNTVSDCISMKSASQFFILHTTTRSLRPAYLLTRNCLGCAPVEYVADSSLTADWDQWHQC